MPGVLVNQGKDLFAQAVVNQVPPQDLRLKIFTNPTTPIVEHTEADYTEATFQGYRDVVLPGVSWKPSGRGTLTFDPREFVSAADQPTQQAYGYYLVHAVSGQLVGAERFASGPYPIGFKGDRLEVTPTVAIA